MYVNHNGKIIWNNYNLTSILIIFGNNLICKIWHIYSKYIIYLETNDLKLNTNNKWQMKLELLTNGIKITKCKFIYARDIIVSLCNIEKISVVS